MRKENKDFAVMLVLFILTFVLVVSIYIYTAPISAVPLGVNAANYSTFSVFINKNFNSLNLFFVNYSGSIAVSPNGHTSNYSVKIRKYYGYASDTVRSNSNQIQNYTDLFNISGSYFFQCTSVCYSYGMSNGYYDIMRALSGGSTYSLFNPNVTMQNLGQRIYRGISCTFYGGVGAGLNDSYLNRTILITTCISNNYGIPLNFSEATAYYYNNNFESLLVVHYYATSIGTNVKRITVPNNVSAGTFVPLNITNGAGT